MNKANSPVLDKILNGHKFKVNKEDFNGYYQAETEEDPFIVVYKYLADGTQFRAEGTINENLTGNNRLALYLHGFGSTSPIYFDCLHDLTLLDG